SNLADLPRDAVGHRPVESHARGQESENRDTCGWRIVISPATGHVTLFYKRECQEQKLPPEKFFLTSSPCIDMTIRDLPDSPDSSFWRNDVHRFLMHQAVWL